MEEIEAPTEHAQEEIHHHARHSTERWILGVALSSALLAALAAVASLLSAHHADEAMIDQIRASDQWSYFQAKGIKAAIHASRLDFLRAVGKTPEPADVAKLETYAREQEEIKKDADEKEASARSHLVHHDILARGVTLFQVAIAVAAIAVLIRRRSFWLVSMAFGVIGTFFLIQGLLPR